MLYIYNTVALSILVSSCTWSSYHWLTMKSCPLFSQDTQPVTSPSEPPGSDSSAHDHPSLNLLPEIQTPPPEEIAAAMPSELQIPSTENTSPQDAPVLSIDTLTPPPEADPSLSEGLVKGSGEEVFVFLCDLTAFKVNKTVWENTRLSAKVKASRWMAKRMWTPEHYGHVWLLNYSKTTGINLLL